MKEIALHILDIVQNSIHAKATRIEIELKVSVLNDSMEISITDNGTGMDAGQLQQVLNPFFTTKKKKTGLGIPLLKQHAEMTGGNIQIESEPGKGTCLKALFGYSHFDRQPLGNIVMTITGLIRAYPQVHFIYRQSFDDRGFLFDTDAIKEELGEVPINNSEVINFLENYISENLKELQIN